jgi:hypothetical protein
MTQLTNDYIYEIMGTQGYPCGEDIFLFAGAGTTAATGYAVRDQVHRVITSIANAALTMKSILTNDAPQLVVIINDSAQTIKIFPYTGGTVDTTETINGATTGFSIATVTTAVFFSSLVAIKRKGGSGSTTPALNWSAATFS